MINKIPLTTLLVLFCLLASTTAQLSKEQTYTLFNNANQAFRQANSITADPDQTERLYEKAILNYEKIITDGQIKNPGLYYNLANAYLLKGDLGDENG